MAWMEKIELNQAINALSEEFDLTELEKPCPEKVRDTLAEELEKSRFLRRYANKIRAAKSIAEVNRILSNVFDAADANRVWCGM